MSTVTPNAVLSTLEQDGIVLLPQFLEPDQLERMRAAFESRLQYLRWSDVHGYEKSELFRHMVEDVLTLDQGFVDVALHPVVKETLREYLGERYELVEAKGWKSLPTRRDFHGWHGDAWYDQAKTTKIPREVKLALYLTDVTSGFFEYVKGSHRKQPPRQFGNRELETISPSQIIQLRAPAGSAFLFDTSGIHRQSVPILEPRLAVFYNYHDPSVPLQEEDVSNYRYHPLVVSTAYLGNLSAEDCSILGFGNKHNHIPAFVRHPSQPWFHHLCSAALDMVIYCQEFRARLKGRVERILKRRS